MAKLGGAVSVPEVELLVQNYFFGFQVLQVFLVTTLASTAAAAVSSIIDDPSSTPRLLAENLPKASNFYISYFILQGLTISTMALLQLAALIINFVLDRLFSSTPRKIYERWSNMKSLPWGSVFPIFTLLTVICMFIHPQPLRAPSMPAPARPLLLKSVSVANCCQPSRIPASLPLSWVSAPSACT